MAVQEPSIPVVATRVDISPGLPVPPQPTAPDSQVEMVELLRQLLALAQEQFKLSQQMAALAQQAHQQRHTALRRWQKENPRLVRQCREALAIFENVQKGFLNEMTEYIIENEAGLLGADFMLTEFSDRFGPRLVHLSTVQSILQQLSGGEDEQLAEPMP